MTFPPALSIRQPYAWLICAGHKPVENRDWSARFRGWVIVHASRHRPSSADWSAVGLFAVKHNQVELPLRDNVPFGAYVGAMHVADCVTAHPSPWFNGPNAFVIDRAVAFAQPVDGVGRLGFFQPYGAEHSLERHEYRREAACLEAQLRIAGVIA